MVTDVDCVNRYCRDSDSEAEFPGFDAVDLDEIYSRNKGKNKITELRTILQRESQNS
jgi:hypothetical protein